MSEMIKRCIKAGVAENSEFARWGLEERQEFVEAIIKAMREPTREMRRAGFESSPHDVGGCRDQISSDKEWMRVAVLEPYQAMIDAALADQPPESAIRERVPGIDNPH